MRIESALFGDNAKYERMARALVVSAEANSPLASINVTKFEDRDNDITRWRRAPNLLNNSRKTKHHQQLVSEAADGEVLCMIDADTLILGELSAAEAFDFDLAVTIKPADSAYEFNSGVVFVRVSRRTKEWYEDWLAVCMQMIAQPQLYANYKTRYGGINQSSLGCLLESRPDELNVLRLPCAEWNSVRETWPEFSPSTKVVHLLGKLRVACMRPYRRTEDSCVEHLKNIWRTYDRLAQQVA